MATSGQYQTWMEKMSSSDADFRFMALNDLMGDLTGSQSKQQLLEDYLQRKLISSILKLLDDSQSTIQNLAIKCLSLLMKKLNSANVQSILDSLLDLMSPSSRMELREVSGIALKTVVMDVPEEEFQSGAFTKRLMPKLLTLISNSQGMQDQTLFDSLDILTKVLSRLDTSQVTQNSKTLESMLKALQGLLEHSRAAIRKRSIASFASLVPLLSDTAFETLVAQLQNELEALKKKNSEKDRERLTTFVSVLSVIGRCDANRLGPQLKDIVPLLLDLAKEENEDLAEHCLQALEGFALKCPVEITTFLDAITELAVKSLKYDPNFNDEEGSEGGMDVDDESYATDEDDDVEEDDDNYSDDDDMSWKIRKASAKLLAALFSTRTDYLADFYSIAASSLVSRFKERIESVRVEVISAFATLINQSGLLMDRRRKDLVRKPSSSTTMHSSKKRRSESGSIETAVSPHSHQALFTLGPQILKRISRHFLSKITSLPTAQADLALLKDIASIAPDVLEPHLVKITSIFDVTFSSSSGSNSNLRFLMLEFLNTLFLSASDVSLYLPLAQKIYPPLLVASNEKFTKVAKEALLVIASLLRVMRPLDPSASTVANPQLANDIGRIYQSIITQCQSSDLDLEVKQQCLLCLGAVVYHAMDMIPGPTVSQVVPLLLERLQNESYRLVTLKVIYHVLSSPLDKSLLDFSPVLSPLMLELSTFLRKADRQLKLSSLQCLELLLTRYGTVPNTVIELLMADLKLLFRETDVHVVSGALALFSVLVKTLSSNKAVMTELKTSLTPVIVDMMVQNPNLLSSGSSAKHLSLFWNAVWDAGDLSLHDHCLSLLAQTGSAEKYNKQTHIVASKCIAILVSRGEKEWMLNLVKDWVRDLSEASPSRQHLLLLTLGEIGSRVDMTSDLPNLFSDVLKYFSSPPEDVKYAAAFALGNISLGNVEKSLSGILTAIRQQDEHRYLLFVALKEVISSLSSVEVAPEHLRKVAPDIWSLLIQNLDLSHEDTVRQAIAECLGKISLFEPKTYIPQLQNQIKSGNTITAITAVRYTLMDNQLQSDDSESVLLPLIQEIVSIPPNADPHVVRTALSTLTSAAHNKPKIVKRIIGDVLAFVYRSTITRKELIQLVDFGPFKHRVDDGLESRMAAYECMDTLVDTCLANLEIYEFISNVVGGLSDDSDEIKMTAFMILQRLTVLHPKAVHQKSELFIPPLKATLTRKTKENAVKQEIERVKDVKKAAVRFCMQVSSTVPDSSSFMTFMEEMKAASPELKELFLSDIGHGMIQNKSIDAMEF